MNKKKSVNPIPLSLRDRKRYLVFQLISDKSFQEKSIAVALKNHLIKLFGELGLGKMNYQFILFNEKTAKGIIKCRHTATEDLKAGILLLKEVNGIKVIPRTLRLSGTVKKAKSFA
ncbi:MAG: Rpp14/Pop5 family protein [archaeon]